jgi:hypothetical protein
MHFVINIVAAIILLFFILAGWQKGFMLSLLGVARVILAYGMAFLLGRYAGAWLGEIAHRPRIVTIPVVAGLTFVVITFFFHVLMSNMRDEHKHKEEKEDYQHPWYSSLSGSAINLGIGLFSMIFLFWLGDLFLVGMAGTSIPGAEKSVFGRFARRVVYESTYLVAKRGGRESQAAATARVVSNPAQGVQHLENVIRADSVQQLLTDKQFADDLLSGDADRIADNLALRQLFNDKETLAELRELGMVWEGDKKSELCQRLSKFGANENIQASIKSLKEKQLLSTDKITLLIRDPDFDVIIGELLK